MGGRFLARNCSSTIFLYTILVILAGCTRPSVEAGTADSPAAPVVTVTDVQIEKIADVAEPITRPPPYAELVIWTPPFMVTDGAAAVLDNSYRRLEQTYKRLDVVALAKAETGQAGLLAFLKAAQRVAPAVLPDVVVLQGRDLWSAAEAGLISPLTPEELSLFPNVEPQFLDATRYEGRIYGLPYAIDLEHLVYRRDLLSEPPLTWDALLSQNTQYLFAAGSTDGRNSDFLLAQYMAAGGEVDAEGGLAHPEALAAVFEFLQQGQEQGIIPNTALNLASSAAVWSLFTSSDVAMAHVPASLYGEQRLALDTVGYGQMPTPDGQPAAIVRTWNFALTTTDAKRREQALSLLADLFTPQIQGEWSHLAHYLPTQSAALSYWDTADPYATFLRQLLEHATVPTSGHPSPEFVRTIHHAQRNLLSGDITPQEAVATFHTDP